MGTSERRWGAAVIAHSTAADLARVEILSFGDPYFYSPWRPLDEARSLAAQINATPPDPLTAVKALPEWRELVETLGWFSGETNFLATDARALVAAVEHPEPIDDTPHPGTEGRT